MNDEQTRVQEAQTALGELCQKYNVRIEPRVTIVTGQVNSDLVIVANPSIVAESPKANKPISKSPKA